MTYLFFITWNLIAIFGGACSVATCYMFARDGSYSGVAWSGMCTIINVYCACKALDWMRTTDAVYGKTMIRVWWWRSKWRIRWFTLAVTVRTTFAIVYMLGYMAVRFAYHLAKKRGWHGARWHMSLDVTVWRQALTEREIARAKHGTQIEFNRIMALMDLHSEMLEEEIGPEKYRKLCERVKADLAKREEES